MQNEKDLEKILKYDLTLYESCKCPKTLRKRCVKKSVINYK